MGKPEKIREEVLGGNANANIRFDDLCKFLAGLGFKERTKGSHKIYSKTGVRDIINLQPMSDGKAKPYQVRQVRAIITQYQL